MITRIENLLTRDELDQVRERLAACAWADGAATAGPQSRRAKHNLQIGEAATEAEPLRQLILARLADDPVFVSAALPVRIFPPLFNRYEPGMAFGDHIDNAVRQARGVARPYRTDLSATLFLSDPETYDGGELVFGENRIRGAAGELVLYSADQVHRVEPVTRGVRLAAVFWVQSMIRGGERRALLHKMDQAIAAARADLGDDHPAAIALTGCYHNLIRMWAEV